MPLRDAHDTRDRQIRKLIDAYEKNTRSVADSKKRQEIANYVEKEVMTKSVYEKGK